VAPNNPSEACATTLVDELVRLGVTDAVLAPGSRSTALAIAAERNPRLDVHVEVDERSAGFLALGFARASGRPAPVVVTSGTAVANLHPAVVEADTAAVPLLLLTADRPPELRATGANQAIDQVHVFGRALRFEVDLGVPEDRQGANALWRSTVARALAEACGLRAAPGPVQVNLSFREPTVPEVDDGRSSSAGPFAARLTPRPDGRAWVQVRRGVPQLAPTELDALADELGRASRGLVVAGPGVTDGAAVRALAEALDWPLAAEPGSDARSGPNALAHAPLLLGHAGFAEQHVPDVVLQVGRAGLAREVATQIARAPRHLLLDGEGLWHDPARSLTDLVVADVGATATVLARRLAGRVPTAATRSWTASWLEADGRARRAVDDVLDAEGLPSEPRVARDVAAALPDGASLVVSSSMPVRDLDRFQRPRQGLRIHANRGASGIDGTVSTVLGVALAGRAGGGGSATVGLIGDLAFLHDANGLLLAPAGGPLDVVFVLVDNDGGGIFSFLPPVRYPDVFERVFATPHGRDLGALARFHGAGYLLVERAVDLPGALTEAVRSGGVQVLHVRTSRVANRELHARLDAAVGRALDAGR